MGYRFEVGEALSLNSRRVANEQLSKAITELDDADLDVDEKVHQIRKRCKKLRALLRLIRPALGNTYSIENKRFRNVARKISYVRDVQVLVETFDDLSKHYADQMKESAFASIRQTGRQAIEDCNGFAQR